MRRGVKLAQFEMSAEKKTKVAIDMNIVFWFLVVAALVAVWFLMSSVFKDIGEFFLGLWDETKNEMKDESRKDEYDEG